MRKSVVVALISIALIVAGCNREKATDESASATAAGGAPPLVPEKGEQGQQAGGGDESAIGVGKAMPPFKAEYLNGKSFTVADQKGKVVLLNLWATWCGPCRYEIPELQKLHSANSGKNFAVVGVSVDDEGQKNEVTDFVRDQKITYPIVLDPEGKLADIFRTSVIPTSALIDRNGKIVWYHIGIVQGNDPELREALEKAL